MRGTKRSNVVGAVVDEPPKNSLENKTHEANSLEDKNEEVEEDNYTRLRRAVQEHRNTMKEYYRAAIDAFKKGDHDRANKLVEKQFRKYKLRHVYREANAIADSMVVIRVHQQTDFVIHSSPRMEASTCISRDHLGSLNPDL